jgi:hypothetical protein
MSKNAVAGSHTSAGFYSLMSTFGPLMELLALSIKNRFGITCTSIFLESLMKMEAVNVEESSSSCRQFKQSCDELVCLIIPIQGELYIRPQNTAQHKNY